ncbi:MAG: hypothetical protein AAGI22_12650 [Planctomycetota bacterium]
MLLAALLLATAPQETEASVPELDFSNFAEIVRHVVPGPDEMRWRSVPWRPTLFDGLREGARLKRPVLLWAMNGHPLGST